MLPSHQLLTDVGRVWWSYDFIKSGWVRGVPWSPWSPLVSLVSPGLNPRPGPHNTAGRGNCRKQAPLIKTLNTIHPPARAAVQNMKTFPNYILNPIKSFKRVQGAHDDWWWLMTDASGWHYNQWQNEKLGAQMFDDKLAYGTMKIYAMMRF